MGKFIALLKDPSSHGGRVITHNQDGTLLFRLGSKEKSVGSSAMFGNFMFGNLPETASTYTENLPAVEGALHKCPKEGHGTTSITAVTIKSFHNDKLILTTNAVAGCGAKILPPDRCCYIE